MYEDHREDIVQCDLFKLERCDIFRGACINGIDKSICD